MGLLQDPLKALEQADWYIKNSNLEKFPGAFELAAGNLCRQTAEQILYILCFFSGMPTESYLKRDRRLQVAGKLLEALDRRSTTGGRTYWQLARKRGPRIRKFARQPQSIKMWIRELNEPSHFSARHRRLDSGRISTFIIRARRWFDEKDKYLIVAALNEMFSRGRYRAVLSDDADNTPGVEHTFVVSAALLQRTSDGSLSMKTPVECCVISGTEIPRGHWPSKIVFPEHATMALRVRFVTKRGDPVNLTNMAAVLESLAKTPGQRRYLVGRLRRLGFEVRLTGVQ